MNTYTVAEVIKFFCSYGTECDKNEVENWIKNTRSTGRGNQFNGWDFYGERTP